MLAGLMCSCLMCPRVERCTYLRQAIVFTRARQFTMNLHYTFNNCAFARVCTYVLSTQLGVLRDELRVLSVRKCADFHENRLIYAYLTYVHTRANAQLLNV